MYFSNDHSEGESANARPPQANTVNPTIAQTEQPSASILESAQSEEPLEDETPNMDAVGEESFEDLMLRVYAGEADDDEQLRFWEELRKTDKIDGVIATLREEIDQNPEDVTGRMTLAQVYVTKLLSAPSGPERGLISEKSQELWGQVLELDPDNFEAQYRIAFSLSRYPDFLNRTDDAIQAYEKAIGIEGRIGSSEETAQAYVNLARLHQRGGDPASALEVLQRGVSSHPENEIIGSQLAKLNKGFVFESE